MAKPRFTLYKHIKIGGTWRYCRAAVAVNNKVKPHIVVVGGGNCSALHPSANHVFRRAGPQPPLAA